MGGKKLTNEGQQIYIKILGHTKLTVFTDLAGQFF